MLSRSNDVEVENWFVSVTLSGQHLGGRQVSRPRFIIYGTYKILVRGGGLMAKALDRILALAGVTELCS